MQSFYDMAYQTRLVFFIIKDSKVAEWAPVFEVMGISQISFFFPQYNIRFYITNFQAKVFFTL